MPHQTKQQRLEERKTAYKKAVEHSGFELSELRSLHKIEEDEISDWLNDDSCYPDFQAIYEIYLVLKRLRKNIPIEIERLLKRSLNRSYEATSDIQVETKKGKVVGKRVQNSKRLEKIYIFEGEQKTVRQVGEILGVSTRAIYPRISQQCLTDEMSDISFLRECKYGPSPSARVYVFESVRMTASQISKALDMPKSTIYKKIVANNLNYDDADVSFLRGLQGRER